MCGVSFFTHEVPRSLGDLLTRAGSRGILVAACAPVPSRRAEPLLGRYRLRDARSKSAPQHCSRGSGVIPSTRASKKRHSGHLAAGLLTEPWRRGGVLGWTIVEKSEDEAGPGEGPAALV